MNTAQKGTVHFWSIVSGTHGMVTAVYESITGIVTLDSAGNPIRLTVFPPTGFFDLFEPSQKVEVIALNRRQDITVELL